MRTFAPSLTLLCAIATFVLMYDHQKLVSAVVVRDRRAVDRYTTKYDNIDVDRILSSRRLLQNYMNCLLDKGPCTAEGKELKTYLPEALATECAKCSAAQKKLAGKVLAHLLQNHRDFWDALLEKYDPEGKFSQKYALNGNEDDDYTNEEN